MWLNFLYPHLFIKTEFLTNSEESKKQTKQIINPKNYIFYKKKSQQLIK